MRERRPLCARDRHRAAPPRDSASPHRRSAGLSADLVPDVMQQLGFRWCSGAMARLRKVRRAIGSAVLVAALAGSGVVLWLADRPVDPGPHPPLAEILDDVGRLDVADWSEWLGEGSATPEASIEPDRFDRLVAAAPWSPV